MKYAKQEAVLPLCSSEKKLRCGFLIFIYYLLLKIFITVVNINTLLKCVEQSEMCVFADEKEIQHNIE